MVDQAHVDHTAASSLMPEAVTQLRVSAHIVTLDPGVYCLHHAADSPRPDAANRLPNVCITPMPGHERAAKVCALRPGGWLDDAAALVHVDASGGNIIVTTYQTDLGAIAAPRIQIIRLS
jgi:hypothetical protein